METTNDLMDELHKCQVLLEQSLAENARLQSVIDEANAQPAIGEWHCSKNNRGDNWAKFVDGFEPVRGMKLYASPIPAQQSNRILFNGSDGHAGYVIEEQQSPAVAVPYLIADQLRHVVADAFNAGHEQGRKNPQQKEDGLGVAVTMRETYVSAVAQILASQSPRITEQDALPAGYREEWKRNVMLMWLCVRKHDSSIPSDVLDYMREQLLAKLNKPDSVGG